MNYQPIGGHDVAHVVEVGAAQTHLARPHSVDAMCGRENPRVANQRAPTRRGDQAKEASREEVRLVWEFTLLGAFPEDDGGISVIADKRKVLGEGEGLKGEEKEGGN